MYLIYSIGNTFIWSNSNYKIIYFEGKSAIKALLIKTLLNYFPGGIFWSIFFWSTVQHTETENTKKEFV